MALRKAVRKIDEIRTEKSFQVCVAALQLQIARYYNLAGDNLDPRVEMRLWHDMTDEAYDCLDAAEIQNDEDHEAALLHCIRNPGDRTVAPALEKALAYHRNGMAEYNKAMAELTRPPGQRKMRCRAKRTAA